MFDTIPYSKSSSICLFTECVTASLLDIGYEAGHKQKSLHVPVLTCWWREQMVNKQIQKQIYKVKHTILDYGICHEGR